MTICGSLASRRLGSWGRPPELRCDRWDCRSSSATAPAKSCAWADNLLFLASVGPGYSGGGSGYGLVALECAGVTSSSDTSSYPGGEWSGISVSPRSASAESISSGVDPARVLLWESRGVVAPRVRP